MADSYLGVRVCRLVKTSSKLMFGWTIPSHPIVFLDRQWIFNQRFPVNPNIILRSLKSQALSAKWDILIFITPEIYILNFVTSNIRSINVSLWYFNGPLKNVNWTFQMDLYRTLGANMVIKVRGKNVIKERCEISFIWTSFSRPILVPYLLVQK